jgi:hypothetical protein
VIEALIAELEELRAEVAEHRAARGIEAPAGWQRSEEALWERAASERRYTDGDEVYDECPDGWLLVGEEEPEPWGWRWILPGGSVRAEGTEATCLQALAAAEAALAAKREGA